MHSQHECKGLEGDLIVGSRGRGHSRGTVLDSVRQAVLRHAHVPIAIVHHRRGTTAKPPAGAYHLVAS
ncbi:universal stress protein [Pseudonocardia sp. Cha107L01]|uniref:universal stress protein n=1 Tax=Pseudonocardia sp. Cha107L01 TaxID=3457576 RepID=UPI00403E880F